MASLDALRAAPTKLNLLAGARVARAACLGATASAPGGREVGRSGVGSMVND